MIEFYLGFRVFYIKSTKEEFYPPLFGAGEVQVGHEGGSSLWGAIQVSRREGFSILGGLHSWVRQSHGPSGPVLAVLLLGCAVTMTAQICV